MTLKRPAHTTMLTLLTAACGCLALPACKGTGTGGRFDFLKRKPKGETAETAAATAATEPAPAAPAPVALPARTAEETAFLEKCAALSGAPAVAGKDGWFFAGAELKSIAKLAEPDSSAIRTAIGAISDYKDQLSRRGVKLVFVPVPPKAVIYPDRLAKDLKIKVKRKKPARLDSTLQFAYDRLRAKGIAVVDPTEALIAQRDDKKKGPAYPKTGDTWAPRGAAITAALIAKELNGTAWGKNAAVDGEMTAEEVVTAFTGPLPAALGVAAPAENLTVRNIGRAAEGKLRSVTFSQGGKPLALMGDGSILAWREANNPAGSNGVFSSLADHVAAELKLTPDVFPSRSDGRNAPRLRIMRDGTAGRNTLGSAKVVVWVVDALDLTNGDWQKVPMKLAFHISQPELNIEDGTGASVPPVPPQPSPPDAPAPGEPAAEAGPVKEPLPQ